jgi:carboxymethylenebutenolidase
MFWRSEFTGVVPFDKADLAWERLKAFDWDRAVDDARTAADWLRASSSCTGKIAAIGFCMGGRTAFLAASRAGVDAAVSLYALGIAKHLDEVRNVEAPVQFHYGLEDEHIPREEIDAVAAAAKDNGNVEVHLYPGAGHGFFTEGRPAYHPDAVAAANAHIDRLLSKLK